MLGPSTSNRRGTTSTCTPCSLRARTSSSCSVGSRLRERDDHALDVERFDDRGQLRDRAQHGELAETLAALARTVVDEADHVDAELGMLQQLARDPLADVAGADDDRVLDVRVGPPHDGTGEGSRGDDERHRKEPEQRELRKSSGSRSPTRSSPRTEPGADGEHVEHAEEVVDRRVVRPLLVARVEPVQAAEHDPQRQRELEDHELGGRLRWSRRGVRENASCVSGTRRRDRRCRPRRGRAA